MTRQSAASIANHAPCSVFIGLVLAAGFFLLSGPRSVAAQPQEGQDPPKNGAYSSKDDFEKEMAAGRAFIQRGNFAEAAKSFSRAAEARKGDCSDYFRMVSQCYLQMARFTEAAEAARKAIALKPADEADIQNLLGVELYLLGDDSHLSEAAVAFKRALELTKGKLPEVYFNLGYTLIKQGKIAEGTDALKDYLKVAPDGANAYEARAVIANPKLAGERIARNFKVTTIDGKDLSLEALRGKIVLLEFWATWCGPCRVEMPEVRRIWEKYRTERFVLVGIS